jgi:glycerol-1-phosphate dehydrogenase [NAD(P)+]
MMDQIFALPHVHLLRLNDWHEHRPVGLVYSRAAWDAVQPFLHLPVAWQVEPLHADVQAWEQLFRDFQGEVVYAVGGGLAVDAAKYLAAYQNLPLVSIPTALSVDAFLTVASGVRQEGCVRYIETKAPDELLVDLHIIGNAPPHLRAAGLGDVLSISTGSWDWQFAEERGQNPKGMAYIPYLAQAAQAILQGVLECADAAGRGDSGGLKQLLDCLELEVQLCNQVGHARPEEGSEHYFAYAVESLVGYGYSHNELVGPGILLMAERQNQDTGPLRKALLAVNTDLHRLPETAVQQTLQMLPDYVRRHGLPYGIAHELATR